MVRGVQTEEKQEVYLCAHQTVVVHRQNVWLGHGVAVEARALRILRQVQVDVGVSHGGDHDVRDDVLQLLLIQVVLDAAHGRQRHFDLKQSRDIG